MTSPAGAAVNGRAARALSVTFMVCSLLMAASMIMVIWNLQDSSLRNANTASRFATIESLVDHGTFYINKSRYVFTIDKYKVGDHYMSSKPPVLSTLAAGVYYGYQKLTGEKIRTHEGNVVRVVSLFTGGLAHLVFLIFFYRLCWLLMERELAIMVSMAAASFAYLGVAYATHINNHSIAAALGVAGLYYACRIRNGHAPRAWHWPLAGLILGLLPTIDLSSLAITAAIGLYLLSHDWKKTLLWFAPALLPGAVLHLALTYEISGSFEIFYLNSDLKKFKGFHFRNAGGIDGLREPKHIYAWNVLLGHHGLFSMTPLLAFGLWELGRSLWRRRWLPESLVALAAIGAFLTFFIYRTRNYGGWSVGMRWLVPIMPLLLLYFGLWVDRLRVTRMLWTLVLAAFLVSCFHVQDGLTSPFQFSVWHNWLEDKPNRNRQGKVFNVAKRKARKKARRAKPRRQRSSKAAAPAPPPKPPPSAVPPSEPPDAAPPRPASE